MSLSATQNKKSNNFAGLKNPFEQETFGCDTQIISIIRQELSEENNFGPLAANHRKALGFGTGYSLKQLKEIIADIYLQKSQNMP